MPEEVSKAKVIVFVPKGNKTVDEVREAQIAVLAKMSANSSMAPRSEDGESNPLDVYDLVDSAALMTEEMDLSAIGRMFIAAGGADLIAFGEGWNDSVVLTNIHRIIIEFGMLIAFE
mgnify:CR=1 FL=1